MNFRNIVTGFFIILSIGTVSALAQETLATANGQSFTVTDLSARAQQAYELSKTLAAGTRREELEDAISDILIEQEAKLRKTTTVKLLELEVNRKVADPAEAEISAVYDANRSQFGNASLEQARPSIVRFLRRDKEAAAHEKFVETLKKKVKVTPGVDINSPDIKPADVIATVGLQKITAAAFSQQTAPIIYQRNYQIYSLLFSEMTDTIRSTLVMVEARNEKVEPEALLAREITDKLSQPGATADSLENAFYNRLWKKYDVKIFMTEPEPLVQNISADDDPSQGNAAAPVTVVMFSDFQCSVCAAAHPIVKEVIKSYGDKVRLVVRDFPLPGIHPNAQKAAEAAGAANAQGKFFEYIEILYSRQDALDTPSLKKYATEIGLNRVKFDAELDKGIYAAEIKKDIADGESYSVPGTPTIFVNGMRLMQNSPDAIRRLIDRALSQKASPNK